MENNQPNYYAIIPANVRYDKSLVPSAKLLYGEITALSNREGFCYATNEYFADLYQTSEKTITRWLKNLADKNYITTKLETFRYNDGTVKKIRYIYIVENSSNHMDKNVQNHMDNHIDIFDTHHMDKNVPYNNTYNNNIKENILKENRYNEMFEQFYNAYPKKVSKANTKKWFEKNKPNEQTFKQIMEALEKHKKQSSWNKDNGQFIPHPSTWLNQRRFEDELDVQTSVSDSYAHYQYTEEQLEVMRRLAED